MNTAVKTSSSKPQKLTTTQIHQALKASNDALHKCLLMVEHYQNIAAGTQPKAKIPPYCSGFKAEAEQAVKLNASLLDRAKELGHIEH